MPASLLKHAVMAALAGTGGRKLSGTGGTADPCTTDLCGVPLGADPADICPPDGICGDHTPAVAADSDAPPPAADSSITYSDASPTIPAVPLSADDYVNTNHALLGPEGSYNATARSLYMRANNIPGLHENDVLTQVYQENGDIKVQVKATPNVYDHDQYGCQLFAQAYLNTDASSTTFQNGTDHGEFKTTGSSDGQFDAISNIFEVTVPDFAAAQNRVGDLVADLTIWMICKDPLDSLNSGTPSDYIYLYTEDVDDTQVEGVHGVQGETGVRAQIRRQMIASGVSGNDAWTEDSALDFTVTPQWSVRSHANLPLDVQGTSTLVLKKDIIFPVGKWGDFVEDHNYEGAIQCTNLIEPTLTSRFAGFYDSTVQQLTQSFSFSVGSTCNADVCWGRQYVSQIQWGSTNGANLPYEVPLPNYYADDAQPKIVCGNHQDGTAVTPKTVAVTLDANAAEAEANDHYIGNTATSSDVLGNLTVAQASDFPSYTDFGAAWIGTAAAKDLSDFFDVTQSSASTTSTKWYDLEAEYDYSFAVTPACTTITADGIPATDTDGARSIVCAEPQLSGVSSTTKGKLRGLGNTIEEVQSSLATLLGNINGEDIKMPQKYGETRNTYDMTVSSGQAQVTADLRHTNSANEAGRVAFALDFEPSDTGALSTALFGWETSGGEVLFDPDELPWIRTSLSADVTLGRIQSSPYTVCDVPGADTEPAQYEFYHSNTTGAGCGGAGEDGLFYTQAQAYSDDAYGDDGTDITQVNDAHVWYASSLGVEQAQNLVVCNEASIEFHSQVKKTSKDERAFPGAVKVSKTYYDAQYASNAALRADLAAGGVVHGYKLSGSSVATQVKKAGELAQSTIGGQTFISSGMGTVTGQTISVIAADRDTPLEYSCGGNTQSRDYENNYTMPCGDEPARVLVEDVPYSVSYTAAQVTYAVPATIQEETMTEWDLQHDAANTYTFDLTLDADHGLRWGGSDNWGVTVTAHVPYDKSSQPPVPRLIPSTDVTCTESGDKQTLTCVVKDSGAANGLLAALSLYDRYNYLGDDVACNGGSDISTFSSTWKLRCPWLTVAVTHKLHQNGVAETSVCAQTATALTLPVAAHKILIHVTGSEQIYRGAVSVFQDKADTISNTPFRSADSEAKVTATGQDGEYLTALAVDSYVGNPPQAAPGMRFAIQFQADPDDADNAYEVTSDYLGKCAQQTWSEDCVSTGPMSSPVNITVESGASMVLFVRLHGDANPCAESFKDQPAKFGGEDLSFTISRADTTSKLRHTYTFPLTCDAHAKESTLRIKKKDGTDAEHGEILFPDVVLGDLLQFNGFKLSGRTTAGQAIPVGIGNVTAFPSASGDSVAFADPDDDGKIVIDDATGTGVTFQVLPGDDATISCSYLLVQLLAPVDDEEPESSVTFRVQCPRMKQADAITDALKLNYSITSMTFGLQGSSIQLPHDDASASSVVAFAAPDAECDAVFGGDGPAAVCDLSGAIGAVKPFEKGASAFMTDLDGACGAIGGFDAVSEGASTITLRGDVVRQYTKNRAAFGGAARTFCGRTPYTLSVDRQQDQSTLISVAHPQDMDYDVEVFTLEHQQCTPTEDATEGTTYYHLYVEIEAKRRGVDVSDWSADLDILGVSPAIGSQLTVSGNNITYYGECQSEAQTSQDFSFSMTKSIHGLDYTGMASVAVELQAPDVETVDKLAFSAEDIVITCTRANGESAAFDAACVDGVAAADNVQIVIAVTGDEATAFGHSYSVPTVGGNPADDLGFEYRALTAAGQLEQDIVSSDNQQVRLRALPFAGQSNITVQWTVTRIKASRRLRQVVSYTLGADGSVSKSISFAVAPAVRESDGAAAVGDEIVERIEENTDDNGTTRTTTVVEERKAKPAPTQVEGSVHTTSTRTDEDDSEHTSIIAIAIGTGITGAGLIAVVAYLACTCRKATDKFPEGGGAFATKSVPAFMGAPMRWQRDRFLNNI